MAKNIKKETLLERASETLDIPGNVVAGLPLMEITGFRNFYIENHKGIKEYGKSEIVVDTNRGPVRIKGDEMEIKMMNDREIVINGQLFSVEFVY